MDLPRLWTLLSTISLPTDPKLEVLARLFRFRAVDATIFSLLSTHREVVLVDFGCGQDILLYKYLATVYPDEAARIKYVGIDPLLTTTKSAYRNVTLLRTSFERAKVAKGAHCVVMLAVLEHVDDDAKLIQSAAKLVRPRGLIVGTTPTPLARHPLEFFAYRLGQISSREIEEHKRYPTKESLVQAVQHAQRTLKKPLSLTHRYFELGLNNYFEVHLSHK